MNAPRLTRRATALALAAPAVASAQTRWSPSQPVRVIIPFTPGGTMDPVVRLAQGALQQELGQPVVIDYKPGGATVIGTQEVLRAAPDGHTMIMVANSFAANITLRPSMPYNSRRDFSPICMCTVVPHVLVVHPSVARDFAGFLEVARKPGAGLAFGSYGIGTSNHLGGEQFRGMARLNATHVPYSGGAQAGTDLIGGRLQFMFTNLPDVIQPVQAGQLRAIAISAEARVRDLPEVPTMGELGLPLLLSDSWFGLITRSDVPQAARERLEAAWIAALNRPEVKGRLQETGFTVLARPGQQFGAEIARYAETYAQVIRANNIRVGKRVRRVKRMHRRGAQMTPSGTHLPRGPFQGRGAAVAGWDRMAKVNVLLTRREDFEEMNRIYAEHFPDGNYPARTTAIVYSRPRPNFLLEIEGAAVLA